jgi:hypothetical protein
MSKIVVYTSWRSREPPMIRDTKWKNYVRQSAALCGGFQVAALFMLSREAMAGV